MSTTNLENEWALLQTQFDSYEKHSLIIKLFAVGVLVYSFNSEMTGVFLILILMVLWLQDAIWNTFQSRIENRLLQLENALQTEEGARNISAYQYNSQYLATRPGAAGLVIEYSKQAIRPTVAFPHIVLVLMGVCLLFA